MPHKQSKQMDTTIPVCMTPGDTRQAVVSKRVGFTVLFFETDAYILRGETAIGELLENSPERLELVGIQTIKFVAEYRGRGPAKLCELSFRPEGQDVQKAYFGMVSGAQFERKDIFKAAIMPLPGSILYQKPLPQPKPRTPKQLESAKKRKAESKLKRQAKAVASSLVMEERALGREIMLAETAVEKAEQRLEEAKDRVKTAKAASEAFMARR